MNNRTKRFLSGFLAFVMSAAVLAANAGNFFVSADDDVSGIVGGSASDAESSAFEIPADKFHWEFEEIVGIENVTDADRIGGEWKFELELEKRQDGDQVIDYYYAGAVADNFPEYRDFYVLYDYVDNDGENQRGYKRVRYQFKNVTVNGVPATFIGYIDYLGVKYYYYSTSDGSSGGEISVTILSNEVGKENFFTVNYEQAPYEISYEVKLDGDPVTEEHPLYKYFSLDAVFGENRVTEVPENAAYAFDVTIPAGYKADVYRYRYVYDKDGNKTYTIETLKTDKDDEKDPRYPLGTDLEYDDNLKLTGPSSFKLRDTYFTPEKEVIEDRCLVVEVTTRGEKEAPTFDASAWLKTENASDGQTGRGSTGSYLDGSVGGGNIETSDGWNWRDKDNSDLVKGPQPMKEDGDGYTFEWIFQTNNNKEYILNSLELNGVGLTIPFTPITNLMNPGIEDNDGENKKDVTYTETVLPDGAKATLEYIRKFKGNGHPQRVYRLTITGAKSNITVSGGNLHVLNDGAPEVIPYSLTGVDTVEFYEDGKGWKTAKPADPQVNSFAKDGRDAAPDGVENGYNIRFKLLDSYETPSFKLTLIDGSVVNVNDKAQEGSDIHYNKNDGYYYFRLDGQGFIPNNKPATNIALLYIDAEKVKYQLKYDGNDATFEGNGTSVNVPSVDTNSGKKGDDYVDNYYDLLDYHTITVSPYTPTYSSSDSTDATTYKFKGWSVLVNDGTGKKLDADGKVIDEDGNVPDDNGGTKPAAYIQPAQHFDLTEIDRDTFNSALAFDSSSKDSDGVTTNLYNITFVAEWEKIEPTTITYDIYGILIDEDGEEVRDNNGKLIGIGESLGIIASETKVVQTDGQSVVVFIDTTNPAVVTWLRQHPALGINYAVDNGENGTELVQTVLDGGEVYIKFRIARGPLTFSAELDEADTADKCDHIFSFIVQGPKGITGSFYEYPENMSNEPLNSGTNVDNVKDVTFDPTDGKSGVINVKAGEEVTLYLPEGDYTIYEVDTNGELLSTTGDAYTVSIEMKNIDENSSSSSDAKDIELKPGYQRFNEHDEPIISAVERYVFTNKLKPTDLTITKKQSLNGASAVDTDINVTPGDEITYTVTVTGGEYRAHGVTVTDTIPKGLTLDEDSILVSGGTYTVSDNTITWTLTDDVLNGEVNSPESNTATLTYTVTVPFVNSTTTWQSSSEIDGYINHPATYNKLSNVVIAEYLANSLSITNIVESTAEVDDEKEFKYTITLEGAQDGKYTVTRGTAARSSETIGFSGGVAELTLYANETAVIEGLPEVIEGLPDGVAFTVEQTTPDGSGYKLESVEVNTTPVADPASGASGTIPSSVVFTNSYTVTPAEWTPSLDFEIVKNLKNRDWLPEDSFAFDLTPVGDNIDHVTNGEQTVTVTEAAQTAQFNGTVTFDAAGVYTFTVSEQKGGTADANGLIYDGTVYEVTVNVEDDGNGALVATVKAGTPSSFEFTNVYNSAGSLTITNTVKADELDELPEDVLNQEFTYTVVLSETGETEFSYSGSKSGTIKSGDTITLKHGESITIAGIPEGTEYTVTAGEVPENYELESQVGETGTITKDVPSSAEFVYQYTEPEAPITPVQRGDLTITNTVIADELDELPEDVLNQEFTYTVVLSETDETEFSYSGSKSGTIKSGDTITLKHGESITIAGIPEGTEYTVTAGEVPENYELESHVGETGTITKDVPSSAEFVYQYTEPENDPDENDPDENDPDENDPGENDPGENDPDPVDPLPPADPKPPVDNPAIPPLLGDLTIKKTVEGDGAEYDRSFTFTVWLYDASGNALNGWYLFNGSKTGTIQNGGRITLRHGEQIIIRNLPVGSYYKIVEDYTDDYIVLSTGASGFVQAYSTSVASFVNCKVVVVDTPEEAGDTETETEQAEEAVPDDAGAAAQPDVPNDEPSEENPVTQNLWNPLAALVAATVLAAAAVRRK